MTGDTPPRKSIEVRTLLSFVDYRLVWLNSVPFTPPIQNDSDAQPWCVGNAKSRWRIERDYQELKQEVGLGHFEGRGWRGFHHHATLCIAAYGFLISERAKIPPFSISDHYIVALRQPNAAPDLGKLVSSMIHAEIAPCRSTSGKTISRTLANIRSSDQPPKPMKCSSD